MATQFDITDPIPYPLSNPAGATNFSATGAAYDVAFASNPFFIGASDDAPYRRVTAQYRKQQIDQSREPGEQTLTGWWTRSQSSFHQGAGIKFFEPLQDESLRFQYTESKGVDVWTKGQTTLLNTTVRAASSANTNLNLIGARDNTNAVDALVFTDGSTIKKITMSADTPTVSTYTLSTNHTNQVFSSITTDGRRYFAADTTAVHVGNIFDTTSDGTTYATSGSTNIVLRYAKQRLLAGVNASLYELNANATPSGSHATTALPTPLYTNPNSSWVWTCLAEGPSAFYAAGYFGGNSSIYKITLDLVNPTSLGPDLQVPTVVADFPEGELVQAFDVYLGIYAIICTNRGVRVAIVNDNGNLAYGPLLFDGDCKAVTFDNKFAYVTSTIDGDSGLVRIDLSSPIQPSSLLFAYAWDVYASGETAIPMSADFLGITDRVAFAVPGDGIWIESSSVKVPTGYLRTGFVRYNTTENKIFKIMQTRADNTYGSVSVDSITGDDTYYRIGSFGQGVTISDVNISFPTGSVEYLGFQFNFTRSSTDTTQGPIFTGYQVKSLPAVPRQRLIQYPVMCYDHEKDHYGVEVGYEGSAYDRISQLETIENLGDTIRVEDFRTGESYLGLIEEMDFINRTPTDKRFSGYGGLLLVTIRTV